MQYGIGARVSRCTFVRREPSVTIAPWNSYVSYSIRDAQVRMRQRRRSGFLTWQCTYTPQQRAMLMLMFLWCWCKKL
jgi:hypothetical protein